MRTLVGRRTGGLEIVIPPYRHRISVGRRTGGLEIYSKL